MLRCALKLTHDGTVAVADGSRLLASVEMEKLDNRPRWSTITELADVERVLGDLGIAPAAIERWIVDGWAAGEPIRVGAGTRGTLALEVAGYRETSPDDDVLAPFAGRGQLSQRGCPEERRVRRYGDQVESRLCVPPRPLARGGVDAGGDAVLVAGFPYPLDGLDVLILRHLQGGREPE